MAVERSWLGERGAKPVPESQPPQPITLDDHRACPCGQGDPHLALPSNPWFVFRRAGDPNWLFGGEGIDEKDHLLGGGFCPECGHMAVRSLFGTRFACGYGHQWDA